MAETAEIRKGDELEFLLICLPSRNDNPMLSEEELAAALANAKNRELASELLQKIAAGN